MLELREKQEGRREMLNIFTNSPVSDQLPLTTWGSNKTSSRKVFSLCRVSVALARRHPILSFWGPDL